MRNRQQLLWIFNLAHPKKDASELLGLCSSCIRCFELRLRPGKVVSASNDYVCPCCSLGSAFVLHTEPFWLHETLVGLFLPPILQATKPACSRPRSPLSSSPRALSPEQLPPSECNTLELNTNMNMLLCLAELTYLGTLKP